MQGCGPRLRSFRRPPGYPPKPPHPLCRRPSGLETPKTWAAVRAGEAEAGFPPGFRKPASASLIRPTVLETGSSTLRVRKQDGLLVQPAPAAGTAHTGLQRFRPQPRPEGKTA